MNNLTQFLRRSLSISANSTTNITRKQGLAGSWYIPKPSFGQKLQDEKFVKDEVTGWNKNSHRVGAVGKKVGMMTTYIDGTAYPVTVIEIPTNQITQIKRKVLDGVDSVQVGADEIRLKNVTRPLQGHFARANVPPKRVLMEFKVTRNAMKSLEVGQPIVAKHFVPGQLVTIKGTSIGKGFAGVMKKWNFGGQPATHGVSRSHRSLGSTGCRQTPGRVFKGKKMPGRLGGISSTQFNLQVLGINTALNVIMVKGAVPGKKGGYLKIIDSRSNKWTQSPPFPIYVPQPNEAAQEILFKPDGELLVEDQPVAIAPKLLSVEQVDQMNNEIKEKREKRKQSQN
ncbi:hypothetical protein CYY_005209 [Polysphondylium violaceum]|uniref:Large ribosomal subunit protein uL3m n=1 Tax=Polysphondylium violaceum TaxID=133409 RepID=A0A8J4UYS1_9MYCE|nr:hypothetical protein CYY_005209 [Polysphondylium violaceum]